MRGILFTWRRARVWLVSGLAAPVLLSVPGTGLTQGPTRDQAADSTSTSAPSTTEVRLPEVGQLLDLAACRRLALENQPAVAAARATLAAAVARSQAADNLRVPAFLARDLPIRRQQAALGVIIAQAGVARAEADTLYGVTYSYLSALYAIEQRRVVDSALSNLKDFQERVQTVAGKVTNVTKIDPNRVTASLEAARGRREQAVQGEQRALSALREAIGVGPDCPVVLADTGLFRINPTVDRHQVIAAALAHRPELTQAGTFTQVAGLEISAQEMIRLPNGRTFAANSDIHAQPVPPGSYDDTYSPAALAPEMPTMISGSRADRVEQAHAYSVRAEAVLAKTRNLIALEAEQAYFRWLEASSKLPHIEKAADEARAVFEEARSRFRGLGRITVDEWLRAGTQATELRLEANQARYRQLLALASLERVTGGAFCAPFAGAPTSAPQTSSQETNKERESGKNGSGR